jgi:Ca2+-binding RTX toxin-like protein
MAKSVFRRIATHGGAEGPLLTGITDLDLVVVDGNVRLYSASRPGAGGIVAFDPGAGDAVASVLASYRYGGVVRPLDQPQIALVPGWNLPSQQGMILSAGFAQPAPEGLTVSPTSPLSSKRAASGMENMPAELRVIETVDTGNRVLVVGLASGQGAPMVWTSPGTGALAAVAQPASAPDMALTSSDVLGVTVLGGRVLALVGDRGTHRIAVFLEDGAGRFQPVQMLGMDTGIGIAVPVALTFARPDGVLHALAGGMGSSSITVFRVGGDGRLTPVDHVVDGVWSRFGAIAALEVVETGGRSLVLAAGGDDGLSLLLLLPNGRLLHLESLALGAGNLTALAARALPGAAGGTLLQVFAGGESTGLVQLVVDLGRLAAPRTATGRETLEGGADNDLLMGGRDAVTLSGGASDDILIAGAGAARMLGGAGSDLFVMAANGQRNFIADYDPVNDRLDLSSFPMLRSVVQLTRSLTGDGARLTFGDTVIEIVTADRKPLPLSHFTEGILGGLFRMPIGGVSIVARARAEGEHLTGMAADDQLSGRAGNDTLDGNMGNDRLTGGAGDDLLWGREGRDRLSGGAGDDRLYGGDGKDRLRGGAGNDTLWGGDDADRLLGQSGADQLFGGAGNDWLAGGRGRDTLSGGAGNDTLTGGLGADVFVFWAADVQAGPGGDPASVRITDFTPGLDRLDLTGLGLRHLIDTDAFGGRPGEMRMVPRGAGTQVQVDLDGDRTADLVIMLPGVSGLDPADFLI